MGLVSEELIQRDFIGNPEKIGEWDFYSIGSTSLHDLKNTNIIPDRDYKGFIRKNLIICLKCTTGRRRAKY